MKKHIKKTLSVVSLIILCLTLTILPTFAYDYPTGGEDIGGYLSVSADVTIEDFTNNIFARDITPWGYASYNLDDFASYLYSIDLEEINYQTCMVFDTSVYSYDDSYNTIITFDNVYMSNDGLGSSDTVNMAKRGLFFRGIGSISIDGEVFVNGSRQMISISADFTPYMWANAYAFVTRYIAENYYTNEWSGYFYIEGYIEDGGQFAIPLGLEVSEYVRDAYYDDLSPSVEVVIDEVPIGNFLWNSIQAFLSVELFPNVTLYAILLAVISIPVCVWLLKVVAGG